MSECRSCTTGTPTETRRWFRKNCPACKGSGVEPVTVVVEGLRVESEQNTRGSWHGKHRRTAGQKDLVIAALSRLDKAALRACGRLRVTFARVMGKRGRAFDDDNLVGAFKATRDAVAHAIGVDDGSPWWDWQYDLTQTRGPEYAVRIKFAPLSPPGAAAGEG